VAMLTHIKLVVLALSALFLTDTVHADDPTGNYFPEDSTGCYVKSTEVETNNCIFDALQNADSELNALFKRLVLRSNDAQKKHLKAMQRAWIALRDATCAFDSDYYPGMSAWPTRCQAALTVQRVKDLRELGTGLLWK
jgi:uncharacterized protein YecT (DUF1311 family)